MKYLLTGLCAAALSMPFALSAPQIDLPANDAIPHCGKCKKKCDKEECKDGCKCKKDCKEGCECKKCKKCDGGKEDA